MLLIRHPVSATSSIPYTFPGHKPWNKGFSGFLVTPSLYAPATPCGSTLSGLFPWPSLSLRVASGPPVLAFSVKCCVTDVLSLVLEGRWNPPGCISEERSAGRMMFRPTPFRWRQFTLDGYLHNSTLMFDECGRSAKLGRSSFSMNCPSSRSVA